MKKKKAAPKKTAYRQPPEQPNMVSEPAMVYFRQPVKALPSLKDFSYNEFRKIANDTPFTQAEWAAMLHVSERTLQRYAKTNALFAPINAERALQIGRVLSRAKEVLGEVGNFYHWIKRKPHSLEGQLSFESLTTADGINQVLNQLGRIEHGLFA
jgi:putative toxin-antitoxin system antitoxin component (TIGR02293 family)